MDKTVLVEDRSSEQDKLPEEVQRWIRAELEYRQGNPIMSDIDFDALEARVARDYPYHWLEHVRLRETYDKNGACWVKHPTPMGSLVKTDVRDTVSTIERAKPTSPNSQFICSDKIDGISVSLTYHQGELVEALTRGDGRKGRVIPLNLFDHLDAVPKHIPVSDNDVTGSHALVHVRGELCMSWDAMDTLTEWRTEKGKDAYQHPRNATAGLVNECISDGSALPNQTGARALQFYAFDLHSPTSLNHAANHTAKLEVLESHYGFKVPNWQSMQRSDIAHLEPHTFPARNADGVPCDGKVVLLNEVDTIELSQDGRYTPSHAAAIKRVDTDHLTQLLEVKWTPGRHKLTPVASITPTEVDGAKISKVILKSARWMKENDVRIGDRFNITRSGGVIPKINQVVEGDAHNTKPTLDIPSHCPACNGAVGRAGSEPVCLSDRCWGKEARKIEYALKLFGVKGLSYKTLAPLAQAGITRHDFLMGDLSDEREPLRTAKTLPGAAYTLVKSAINQLIAQCPYPRREYLAACSIRNLGVNTINRLFDDQVPDFESLSRKRVTWWAEQKVNSRRIGTSRGERIVADFTEPRVDALLNDISRVQPVRDTVDTPTQQAIDPSQHDFPYQSVCLTGKPAQLGTWLRKDIIADLEAMDVTVHSSVRADTEALVQGDPSSQTRKTAAAQARGIPIISYEDMRDLMDAPSVSPTHTITR